MTVGTGACRSRVAPDDPGVGGTPPTQRMSLAGGVRSVAPPGPAGAPFPGGAIHISPGEPDCPLEYRWMLPDCFLNETVPRLRWVFWRLRGWRPQGAQRRHLPG